MFILIKLVVLMLIIWCISWITIGELMHRSPVILDDVSLFQGLVYQNVRKLEVISIITLIPSVIMLLL